MEYVEGISGGILSMHQDLNKDSCMDESYKPEFIKSMEHTRMPSKFHWLLLMDPSQRVFAM